MGFDIFTLIVLMKEFLVPLSDYCYDARAEHLYCDVSVLVMIRDYLYSETVLISELPDFMFILHLDSHSIPELKKSPH